MTDAKGPKGPSFQCVYCKECFVDTYDLFKHVVAHDVQWIQWKVEREERFVLVDAIQEIREERFDTYPP